MVVALHLGLLAGVLAGASFACFRFWTRPGALRVVLAIVSGVFPLAGAAMGMHRCDSGTPLWQWLVPGAATMLVVLCVGPLRIRLPLALACALLTVGLSLHYAAVVHGPDYIGNPRSFTLDGQRAEARWFTPVTGFYLRVPDPSRRGAEPAL